MGDTTVSLVSAGVLIGLTLALTTLGLVERWEQARAVDACGDCVSGDQQCGRLACTVDGWVLLRPDSSETSHD